MATRRGLSSKFRTTQVPRCVPKSEPFKCKGVKRGYAFGDDDVPRDADTEYLKVKYSAKNRAPPVRSQRPAVLRCLHAIDATRLHQRRRWVVLFSILSRFGPRS